MRMPLLMSKSTLTAQSVSPTNGYLLLCRAGQDCLDNMHANTQVPKVIGFERISELSGNEDYHVASSFFWDIVTGERSLAFGGNSRREHFPAKDACMDFINDIDGPESCNTNNMLKLTEDLHRRNPEARYADYYELATFNHILSTQHPEPWRLRLFHACPSPPLSQLLRS